MPYLKPGDSPPTKGKGAKLSSKMQRFVDEYFVDLNASEAVLRAGYKSTNPNKLSSELLLHPLVSVEIEKRMAERQKKSELKAEYLIQKLLDMIEKDSTKDSDVLRAIELAGKSIALWRERQEISGPDGEAIKTEQKVKENVADFTSRIARLAASAGKGEVVEFPNRQGNSES